MKFPNDADGNALQSLYKDGVNFKKQQSVEFFVAVSDQTTGEKLSHVLKAEGFNCFLEQDGEHVVLQQGEKFPSCPNTGQSVTWTHKQ